MINWFSRFFFIIDFIIYSDHFLRNKKKKKTLNIFNNTMKQANAFNFILTTFRIIKKRN